MYNHIHPKTKNHKTTFRNGFYRKLSLNKSLDFFSFPHIQTYNIMRLRIQTCPDTTQKFPVYIYACSVSRGALSFLYDVQGSLSLLYSIINFSTYILGWC